jgi:hypothetical protein
MNGYGVFDNLSVFGGAAGAAQACCTPRADRAGAAAEIPAPRGYAAGGNR